MPIIIATTPSAENLVGKSHWWGAPDLPESIPYPYEEVTDADGTTYPEPLTFVCQIRCRDIAPLDADNLLPHTGMLYFFAPIDYFLGYCESPLDYHTPPCVIYSPNEDNLEPYELNWEDTGESIFADAEKIELSQSSQLCDDGMRLLCQPIHDELEGFDPDNDLCLLQIDEDDRWGLRFYDCGTYYFVISRKALAERNFSEVRGKLFFY